MHRGSRQIGERDVNNAVHNNDALEFLRLDFPKLKKVVKPVVPKADKPIKQTIEVLGQEKINTFFTITNTSDSNNTNNSDVIIDTDGI
jgi:hypothetical protein